MRIRLLVLCVVLLGAALGAAGCSSSGTSAPGTSSGGAPGASSGGAQGASSSGAPGASSSGKTPAGKPTGTVTVKSGGKVVCVITLDKNGTGTCKVNTANYTPGKVTFTGTYNGSGGFKSGSGTTTLTIQPTAKQAA
jgi:hypothetical protein